jgi:hypothetical protein
MTAINSYSIAIEQLFADGKIAVKQLLPKTAIQTRVFDDHQLATLWEFSLIRSS